MSKAEKSHPFINLGQHLKALRARAKETLLDASGAVEIDVMQLANFENGRLKPTEDILLLLISHFHAKEEEAVHLWEMAGYGTIKTQFTEIKKEQKDEILYTDSVEVTATKQGVTMNFMISGAEEPKNLAKLGMSRVHAQKIAQAINETLSRTNQ